MLALDHLAVSAATLGDTLAIEALLGVPLQTGGKHAEMATHNRLLSLGPEYLEVIAVDPDAAPINHPRWFDLDNFSGPPRLTNWICRTDNLAELSARFPEAGQTMSFARGAVRWKMLVPPTGQLPFDGAFPALIEWIEGHPAPHLVPQDCAVLGLEVRHPFADELRKLLAPLLQDDRIRFVPHPGKELRAQVKTPHGVPTLT